MGPSIQSQDKISRRGLSSDSLFEEKEIFLCTDIKLITWMDITSMFSRHAKELGFTSAVLQRSCGKLLNLMGTFV